MYANGEDCDAPSAVAQDSLVVVRHHAASYIHADELAAGLPRRSVDTSDNRLLQVLPQPSVAVGLLGLRIAFSGRRLIR